MIREIREDDLDGLMLLYTRLHGNAVPEKSEELSALWERICADKDHHIIVCEENGEIISSCVCVIILNLTHEQRPYALIENVVTREDCRRKGHGHECLSYARKIAEKENCYKIMLLTGAKDKGTLDFYRKAGFNSEDKTAFIMWI